MFTAAAVPIIDCISKIMSDFNSLFVCQIEKVENGERDWVRERNEPRLMVFECQMPKNIPNTFLLNHDTHIYIYKYTCTCGR